MKTLFVVTKIREQSGNRWQIDQRGDDEIIRQSYHSSLTKALNSLPVRLAGVEQFAIIIPDNKVTTK